MTRKKGLRAFSKDELLQELARRHAEELYRDDMTMTDMELAVEQLKGASGDQGIEAMLRRIKPEKPTRASGRKSSSRARRRLKSWSSGPMAVCCPSAARSRGRKRRWAWSIAMTATPTGQ